MTDLERRALLGDKQAQGRVYEKRNRVAVPVLWERSRNNWSKQ